MQDATSKHPTLPRASVLLGSMIAVISFSAQADNVAPADTYVQQYTGEYPLAVTESVTTFNPEESSQYPDAPTYSVDGQVAPGYEASAQPATTPAVSNEIKTVDAAYTTDAPIFVNKSVEPQVALDSTILDDRDVQPGFYAQYGAFGVLDNATRLRAKLTAQLGKPVIIVKDKSLYKVQAGPMQSSQEAFALQQGHPEKLRFYRR